MTEDWEMKGKLWLEKGRGAGEGCGGGAGKGDNLHSFKDGSNTDSYSNNVH